VHPESCRTEWATFSVHSCPPPRSSIYRRPYGKSPASFQIAIEVTDACFETRHVGDEDFDFENQLRDEGFSDREIDELIQQAHFGVMMNVTTDIFDISPAQPFPALAR
jgi:hypothetical protein